MKYNEKHMNIEKLVGEILRSKGLRLAVAESCTGGLIGHRLTNVPGSSTYYMGSITAYSYEAKVRLLGVKWPTLEEFGAVSHETVGEMALGVRRTMAADVGLSVSGIAGPGGGTEDKPVGMVVFGLSTINGIKTTTQIFEGDRISIKEQTAEYALNYLMNKLEDRLLVNISVEERPGRNEGHFPASFIWNEQRMIVTDIGRHWDEKGKLHFLVKAGPFDNTYELQHDPEDQSWMMIKAIEKIKRM